jgi:hypothetical protein
MIPLVVCCDFDDSRNKCELNLYTEIKLPLNAAVSVGSGRSDFWICFDTAGFVQLEAFDRLAFYG